jgi:hypothetical protein
MPPINLIVGYIRIRTIILEKDRLFKNEKPILSWFTEQLFGCNPIL